MAAGVLYVIKQLSYRSTEKGLETRNLFAISFSGACYSRMSANGIGVS